MRVGSAFLDRTALGARAGRGGLRTCPLPETPADAVAANDCWTWALPAGRDGVAAGLWFGGGLGRAGKSVEETRFGTAGWDDVIPPCGRSVMVTRPSLSPVIFSTSVGRISRWAGGKLNGIFWRDVKVATPWTR